jgi:O-succinylbenzoic acid--CoA ligase
VTRLSIFAAAREVPQRLALITETARFTYAELAALTVARAAVLAPLQGRLLLQPQLTLDGLLWLYAAAATGTPFVAVHAQASARELAAVQALTGAEPPPEPAPSARHPATPARELATEQPLGTPDIDPESPFAFIPTSGSSGPAKLVVLSRRAVLASAAAAESNLGLDDQERWLLCLPLSHVAGLSILVRMLGARRTVVLFAPGAAGLLARVPQLGRQIHAERVTLVSLVPALLERLLHDGFQAPSSLRAVLLGGAGCTPELAARARRADLPLLTSYGLTETGSQVTAGRYAERDAPLAQRGGCVSSGRPLAGVEIKIVGGRIAIKSAALFSGYLDSSPRASSPEGGGPGGAAAAAVDADGWFVTADRGALGPSGELYVLGRTDGFIVTGGEQVDPEEVERALRALPQVEDACVFGLPAGEFGQRVVAVVVPAAATTSLQLEQLTRPLRVQLARFKLPRALVVTDALPLTASGKLDRPACASRFGRLF